MALGDDWQLLDAAETEDFARNWLKQLGALSGDDSVGHSVVMMGFMAPPEQQWAFVVAAVSLAETDEQLGHIAAGPAECLLSRHGEACISLVEERASANRAFARMLTGVWKHLMPDEVWQRVQRLQSQVDEPLRNSDDESNA